MHWSYCSLALSHRNSIPVHDALRLGTLHSGVATTSRGDWSKEGGESVVAADCQTATKGTPCPATMSVDLQDNTDTLSHLLGGYQVRHERYTQRNWGNGAGWISVTKVFAVRKIKIYIYVYILFLFLVPKALLWPKRKSILWSRRVVMWSYIWHGKFFSFSSPPNQYFSWRFKWYHHAILFIKKTVENFQDHLDGLEQERRKSRALAMELRLSCISASICSLDTHLYCW